MEVSDSAPTIKMGGTQHQRDAGEVKVSNSLGIKAASRGGEKALSAPDHL